MGKYDTPGMDGVGGQMRKDFKDEADRLKAERNRDKPKGEWGKAVRKEVYNLANDFDMEVRKLFGV